MVWWKSELMFCSEIFMICNVKLDTLDKTLFEGQKGKLVQDLQYLHCGPVTVLILSLSCCILLLILILLLLLISLLLSHPFLSVRFEVLTAVSMKIAVFWVVAPCRAIALMMEAARTSETLVNFYQTTLCYNPEDSNLLPFLSSSFFMLFIILRPIILILLFLLPLPLHDRL
jgi:hypothetical protein